MAKIELNYMLGDEVWFLFPVFEGNVLKGFVPCKGVVQDIEITLMGSSFVKYLVRYKSFTPYACNRQRRYIGGGE